MKDGKWGGTDAPRDILGAIFDQDGLLFDTERIYQECWLESARLQGVDMDPSFPRRFCGVGRRLIAEMAAAEHPELDIERFCNKAVEFAWGRQLAGVPEKKPGLGRMLEFCRAHGIRTAVASSSPRNVVEHNLRAAGVREFFDAVATGDEVENSKPAPDIFLLAAQRIGVAPARCCVFEDAVSGIRGANAAGMKAVMIPDLRQPTDEIRAMCTVCRDLGEAIAALSNRNQPF